MTTPHNPSEPKAELLTLCDLLLDGELPSEGRERLEQLVLGSKELRRCYVEYMQLHASLRQQSSRLGDVPLTEVLKAFPAEAKVHRVPNWFWKAAAAFVFGAGLSGLSWIARSQAVIATLTEVHGARWENTSVPTEPGSKLGAGRLRLAEGLAKMVFRSGAEVTLEGPADFEILGSGSCRLHTGAIVSHVPPAARGFTVETRHARLIDHGTDFGIRADETGQAAVQVMKGEVELVHGVGKESTRLVTREMASINAAKVQRLDEREQEIGSGKSTGKRDELDRGFTHEITTAAGTGAATYVFSPDTKIHFSENLLLLKNASTQRFLRKAVLRFDLAAIETTQIDAAELALQFAPTGFGFASLNGDTTFAVYGVTDDSLDDWSPNRLTWETSPAFSPQGGETDASVSRLLGTFTLPRGVLRGAYSISGPDLVSFLNQDQNRKVSLVVVCVTPQTDGNGAVYGIAGNNHPQLPPPTLRLRLKL